jgi:hypothetical protein
MSRNSKDRKNQSAIFLNFLRFSDLVVKIIRIAGFVQNQYQRQKLEPKDTASIDRM